MPNTPYNSPLFGISPNPAVKNLQLIFDLAKIADTNGLDLISIQDHPYNPSFFDTWTLLNRYRRADPANAAPNKRSESTSTSSCYAR